MDTLPAALRRFTGWFDRQALPLWAKAGWDERRGGFYEALDFNAGPVADMPRRVRVQTRQIHVFAGAAAARLHPDAERLAKAGFDYVLAKACPEEGKRGCVHLLSPDASVIDDRRDLYDQAFLLLACASMWSAFRDERAMTLAERAMKFLDRELAHPFGGYAEDDKGTLPRRQNPHMHLFEAFIAMHAATSKAVWLTRAEAIIRLLTDRFYTGAGGRLIEFFEEDLQPAGGEVGRVLEPGHMAEWATLIDAYWRISHVKGVRNISYVLWGQARHHGEDASGFLVDRVLWGEPAGGSRRLWPQLEYLRSCIVLPAVAAHEKGRQVASSLLTVLFETYLSVRVPGLWMDQYDHAGRPVATDVPASILYHLYEAARDARAYLNEERGA
jgi:mannose-6-phosphate isomerase